jgi:toxin YoeB
MNVSFVRDGWEHYTYWLGQDRKIIAKIGKLLTDIERNGAEKGIGHPEPLSGNYSGWYSRHIDDKHRLIYRVTIEAIEILACKGHYTDK